MQQIKHLLFALFLLSINSYSQKPKTYNTVEIHEAIQKLNFLGNILFLAAHPDDENTRLIAYLSNHVKARTAYLSLTRGDGGQNLIGAELRELLGVIRTQELLAARNIDGGEQYFTRANDFGFSKHPDETLDIWSKNEILSDIVWVIRNFRPDIIINRFDHRTPGTTHGHHTTSAMLSMEAFHLAGDKNVFSEQLNYTKIWQPERLFFNTSWWFYGSQENFDKADKSTMFTVDTGTFYPDQGKSNNEIASYSRNQHLSQGFGSLIARGSQIEYLELLKGTTPKSDNTIFEGIDTSWKRIKGGAAIERILKPIEENFNYENPEMHVPKLLEAYQLIEKLEDDFWKTQKLKALKEIIAACSGLHIEVTTNTTYAVSGETIPLNTYIINRSTLSMQLQRLKISPNAKDITIQKTLNYNQLEENTINYTVPDNTKYTTPYWLDTIGNLGSYKAPQHLIGKPDTPNIPNVLFEIAIEGITIPFERTVLQKYALPDKGEIYQPFDIVPEVSVAVAHKVILFEEHRAKEVAITVTSQKNNLEGTLELESPENWKITPNKIPFSIDKKGDYETFYFTITPPNQNDKAVVKPRVTHNKKRYNKQLITIDYEHIPTQKVLLPAAFNVIKVAIEKHGKNIAYVAGPGDQVPESLRQIGYNVTVIKPEAISSGFLQNFDAVVMGIRAYNIHKSLAFKKDILLDYVSYGGNLIVQYNTSGRKGLDMSAHSPYGFNLSRDRVTNENAAVTFINPQHPILNGPNKITENDFEDWTQERGLYFANEWDDHFTPIFSMHDKGEKDKNGSLLVAKYGKGYYIYTGLSFFRQLPAGNPGAYKLFANMLSIGKEKQKQEKIKG